MRLTSVILLALVAVAATSPVNIFRFDTDDFSNEQSLEVESNAVTGHYTFMTPEGIQFFVRYIADARGFRILESNALPQQRSKQVSANVGVQQRSRQALGTSSRRFNSRESSRRFDSRESNELFDSDEHERRF